ncbi:helix-turn-helix domain-containing protein [Rathayibacter sp. VKM Ac-2760]|uniref:helix-turn-helix transcriptional regulator n=1 Tax=Rathayibacter sp. VKM Ac-2760 TaxID=2609253 RepID=UPI001315CF10|nr:helix-turn-helix domain-containing protein [Rathayibacter sp. VKM Ac-2760]QHC57166.1 helix-turn-helix domain-containing protein [Rathayibacter sp. VKM Ac-2760]
MSEWLGIGEVHPRSREPFEAEVERLILDEVGVQRLRARANYFTSPDSTSTGFPRSDRVEIAALIEGECFVSVGTQRYRLTRGSIAIAGRGEALSSETYDRTECVFVSIPIDQLSERFKASIPLSGVEVISPPRLMRHFQSLAHELASRDSMPVDAVRSLLAQMTGLIEASLANRSHLAVGDLERIKLSREHVEGYVRDHLTQRELSAATLAEVFHTSPRTIHRLFASNGPTLSEYIRVCRLMALAAEISAADSPDGFEALAARCGLCEYVTAARLFRKEYGLTMRQFWKAYRLER